MCSTNRIELMTSIGRLLVVIFGAALLSAEAFAAATSNPNHKGWSGKHPKMKQVQWKLITTKCDKCVKITQQYNETVQNLLNSRYWVKFWREVQKNREKGKADPFWPGKGDITEFEGRAIGANLELLENQQAQLELHRRMVLMLEQQAQYLSNAITECERTACTTQKPSNKKKIKIGGESTKQPFQPDAIGILKQYGINWQGPYSTNCFPCKTYTDQLNALPGWVVRVHMQLQYAERMLQYAKLIDQSNNIKLDFLKYKHPDKNDYSDLTQSVEKLRKEIQALKRLFEKLLTQLSECQAKYCASLKDESVNILVGEPISTCPSPPAHETIIVGDNNDIGSKANFREKARKKAAGLATKAITGLLGIGGGGKSSGPTTYKDPVKKKTKVRNKAEKRNIRVGGVFTEDGLLISTDIKKAPGKGTFQTVYMQTPSGWRLIPIRLFMYEIWRDWKLSVSWTRDTYVDGELVKHEEGGWTEGWRVLVAKGEEIEYAEVPIWEQLGFNTAVSGARSLGTLFPVNPAMLANEPLNLVVHITDPKKDPVVTFPYVFQVSLNNKGKVVIESTERTHAYDGTPCTNPVVIGADNESPTSPGSISTAKDNTIDESAIDLPLIDTTSLLQARPSCPDNWICRDGQTCPPIDNCTIPISDTPVGSSGDKLKEGDVDDESLEDIEEISVTGARRGAALDEPVSIGDGLGDNTASPDVESELAKPSGSDSSQESYTDLQYDPSITLGTGLRYGIDDKTIYTTPEDPPVVYGEEVQEPPIVGIVLKHFAPNWVPKYGDVTELRAKMYVPHPSRANTWIPSNTVQRKMTIHFIARSNEPGKAMNANLDSSSQTSPDLYFQASRNHLANCRDDPTGNGHYGTCTTKFPENVGQFFINSDDYGSYSRLDVSCESCVPLTLVAGVYPEAFKRNQVWEVAVEEQNQEKRAVYVPTDTNRNQISDGYLPDRTSTPLATEDLDNSPVGNGKKGDGLSAYEEYRGFINRKKKHVRTDWSKKTLLVENPDLISTNLFETASGIEVVEIDAQQHRNRIINFNSKYANLVDQHGVILKLVPDLGDRVAGRCISCDRDRPKSAELVAISPGSENTSTPAHELGHAVGMSHHGEVAWASAKESIRPMTGGASDLWFGRVHSGPSLCGKNLPASFWIGTKGDQGSGHEHCIMRYQHTDYVYEQEGRDYDCMPHRERTLFDDSSAGTGPNGFNRTAGDAEVGNCKSQIWVSSQ